MSFSIGIDTGGTYTDAVIVNNETRQIISKAKVLTTNNNLVDGIRRCMSLLEFPDDGEISLVSLSTTLATNAVVEGKGSDIGLIYCGFDIDEDVPASMTVKVGGKLDIMGNVEEPLNRLEIEKALERFNNKVKALVVSGYASVRNPDHEIEIRDIAQKVLHIPVVCAHQLTSALGYHHRTVTAVLNGRLIPLIYDLIDSVKKVMTEMRIDAPLMIVKGDGTLMTELLAKDRPIETVLSGPAASVIGALTLTELKDAVILDMGGTTTDIAEASEGNVKIKNEGARVGGWLTRVQAIEISTFGLGGDSRIYLDEKGNIVIGPEKVIPLCVAGDTYPELIHELRSFRRAGELKKYFSNETDCYMYTGGFSETDCSDEDRKAVGLLQNHPHSISCISEKLGADPETLNFDSLVSKGCLARISLTPTDILHYVGRYKKWNVELSKAGTEILAGRKEIDGMKFAEEVIDLMRYRLAVLCLQSIADFEGAEVELEDSKAAHFIIDRALGVVKSSTIEPYIRLKKPVIAIGAPAEAWVKKIGEMLDVEIIVPDNADVANAYGAAVGQIIEKVEISILFVKNGFMLYTPWKRSVYPSKEEAVFYAVHEGRKHIEHRLMDAGCSRWHIEERSEDVYLDSSDEGEKKYSGMKMVITGTGNLI